MPVRGRQTRTIKREQEIVSLKKQGVKNREIAKLLDIHESTVYDYLKANEAHNLKIQDFQTKLPLHLSHCIAKIIAQLSQSNLDKMTPYQLVGMVSMLIDKQRLITGQSTSNQAILFNIVEQACKPGVNFPLNESSMPPSPSPLDGGGLENIDGGVG